MYTHIENPHFDNELDKWFKENKTRHSGNSTFKSHMRNRIKHENDNIRLSYGTGDVEGLMARDKLCFSSEFCLNDVQFLSVHNATDVEAD